MRTIAAVILIILDITGALLVRLLLQQTGHWVPSAIGAIFSIVVDAIVVFISIRNLRRFTVGNSHE